MDTEANAFLDRIDAIDTDMHARAIPWLLVPDCAPQLSFCANDTEAEMLS